MMSGLELRNDVRYVYCIFDVFHITLLKEKVHRFKQFQDENIFDEI